jgi:hypothetical protein
MKIADFYNDKTKSQQYAERYVNDGSPSGWTEKNTTSVGTNPFSDNPFFSLCYCTAPSEYFREFGNIPAWPMGGKNNWIFIHPDMSDHDDLKSPVIDIRIYEKHNVIPTASGRTVQFQNCRYPDYVKLHYDKMLGRDNRSLPFRIAVAGPEISQLMKAGVDNKLIAMELAFFPEIGARAMTIPSSNKDWGMVWRSSEIMGERVGQIKYLIPFFSLFSRDRNSPNDPSSLSIIL